MLTGVLHLLVDVDSFPVHSLHSISRDHILQLITACVRNCLIYNFVQVNLPACAVLPTTSDLGTSVNASAQVT